MPIVLKYASPAVTGLAAYTAGFGQGQEREKERRLRLLEEQNRLKYGAWQAGLERQFRVGLQGEVFRQQKELAGAEQKWRAGEAADERLARANEFELNRQAQATAAENQRLWAEGQGDIAYKRARGLEDLRWKRQRQARIEERLASGDLYYDEQQKNRMLGLESAMGELMADPSEDDQAKIEAGDQLLDQYETIRSNPRSRRADERALTPEERAKRNYIPLPTGERLWTQPSGEQIQLRPKPEAKTGKEDLSNPTNYGTAYNSVYSQLWAERKAAAIDTEPTPPTRAEVHERMKAMGYDVSQYPNTWEQTPQLPAPGQGGGTGQPVLTAQLPGPPQVSSAQQPGARTPWAPQGGGRSPWTWEEQKYVMNQITAARAGDAEARKFLAGIGQPWQPNQSGAAQTPTLPSWAPSGSQLLADGSVKTPDGRVYRRQG